jgi:hypothetical protein
MVSNPALSTDSAGCETAGHMDVSPKTFSIEQSTYTFDVSNLLIYGHPHPLPTVPHLC